MAWFRGGIEVCEVSGDVKIDGEAFGAGTIKLRKGRLGPDDYFFDVITTRRTTFIFWKSSSITATDNSITFSEVRYELSSTRQTVHLEGAQQSEIQQFLDKLPALIKEKYLREPTRTNRETRQEQKATLHEEPTRGAQQLPSRQEQLQQQKELGEAGLREQLREKENQKQNLERRLRRMEQEMRGKDEQQQNLQRQLREKDGRQENLQRQLREMEQRLREKDEQQQSLKTQLREKDEQQENLQRQLREKDEQQGNSQRQLREMEQRLREKDEQQQRLQTQLREKDGQQENLQRQLEEMRQQLRANGQQLRVKDEEQQNLQRQMREMEQQLIHCQGQLRVKEQEVNELELSFSLAQQTITEQRRQETRDWVVSRNEIQMTDRCLGRGGWGSVNEGRYCGCPVAVKQIYELILSPHNRRLFEREMDIASKCRHPCLLQFIGATNDEGNPLFVTELMETSLRALLEQRQLSVTETTVISLDVALALNYLHQKKPSPIIHRDVSSANVLLWRQGDQWRAKVSDYGTANFLQNTMTVGPGAMIYSAPEALTANQTVKVDVYSFGVLLCEMSIRELPDPEKREEQVLLLTNRVLRGLVRRCLQTDPTVRPNMQQIIDELSTRG